MEQTESQNEKLNEIIEMISQHLNLRDIAKHYGVSHQAIQQYLYTHGYNYHAVVEQRKQERLNRTKIKRERQCHFCHKPYSLDDEGAGYHYCGELCRLEALRKKCREFVSRYHKSERGQAYLKEYKRTHKEYLRQYINEWHRQKWLKMTPEEKQKYNEKARNYQREHQRRLRLKQKENS